MAKLAVLDKNGKKKSDIEMKGRLFDTELNEASMYAAVRAHLINQRTGTADTKTKGEVAGGAAKPWRQKGTGRARVGSIRAPHFTGGGTVFGPSPKTYASGLNKKARKLAFASAVSDKLRKKSLKVLDDFNMDGYKTKEAKAILDGLELDGKVLVVLTPGEEPASRAFRNLRGVDIRRIDNVSTYDVLNCDFMLMSKAAVAEMQEVRS